MKKFLFAFVMAAVLCLAAYKVSAQAMPVFDPTNWLTAIDQLYSAYDQVMNTLQQIQYTYDQLQHYYKEAQTWKLDEVEWDGDLDFRNEIKGVTSSVNRQINNYRMIEYNLTKKQLSFGGQSFTMKDLTDVRYMGNMLMTVESENLQRAAAGFEGRLTEREKAALWSRYGLSPANYYYVKAKESQVKKVMDTVIGWGTEEALQENLEEMNKRTKALNEQAMSEDNTEKSLLQIQIAQTNQLLEEQQRVENLMAQVGSMTAQQQALEDQRREAELAQKAELRKARESNNDPGTLF